MQYRETEFNFISRLMEREGMFYFFEHEQGKHTLVIADQPAAHPILPVTPALPYQPGDGSGAGGDVITRLASRREWRPGKYTMNDYNFETPSTNLEVTSASIVEVGGNRRGTLFIPRGGDEVLIEFLHGDLNRPVVIGSLYNGEDKPPYPLPAGQTMTTIKSNSTKGGGGSNELRFEDNKGSEEIFFHGQKDWRTVVEHDQYETIGNNKTVEVSGNRTETVGKAQTLTIGAACQVTVGAAMNERIGSDKQTEVGGNLSEAVGKDLRLNIGVDGRLTIGRNFSLAAGNGITVEAQKAVTISAADELTLKCGQAAIVLKKNGDISITGKEISIKASGDIVLKGQKILQN